MRISDHMGQWALLFFMCRLTAIAEDTLTEFLAKATGTAVEWIQMPGMKVSSKNNLQTIELIFLLLHEYHLFFLIVLTTVIFFLQPGPDSIGIVAVSNGSNGIAARACGLVGLDPAKVTIQQSQINLVFLHIHTFYI